MTTTNPSAPYFEKVAAQWDNLRTAISPRPCANRPSKGLPASRNDRGRCGRRHGFVAAGLAPLVKHVHVLDGSPRCWRWPARTWRSSTTWNFTLADGLALPLPDASLDAAFANMYLHHCPDPLAAIREMVRILRPGGRLVITDMDTHTNEWLKTEMADVWLGFEREQIREPGSSRPGWST